jgi:prevent-host-death family protein
MTYTVQEAQEDLARLLKEAEEGKDVLIARDGKPVARLAAVEVAAAPQARRIPGQYDGQFKYSDDIFKPLETDEELREYGFDLLIEGKLEKPAA